ncbi:MAG: radical SAM protein [Deltaproteobacteria bacterium]
MKTFDHLAIYLSERCNLACTYCYIEKNYRTTLDLPRLRKAVDFFSDNAGPNRTFTFLGGEPLLTYPLLLKSIDYILRSCRRDKAAAHLFLFTNGTLLTPSVVEELRRRHVRTIISLDGQGPSNDLSRRFAGKTNRSVFEEVIRRLRRLPARLRKDIEINMVVSPHTCASLVDNIKFFYREGIDCILPTILAHGRWPPDKLRLLETKLWELAEFYVCLFRDGKRPLRIHYIQDLMNGCPQMASCRRLTLGADGKFYFCDAFAGAPAHKRADYDMARRGDIPGWIATCKKKAEAELKKIAPPTWFRLHKKNFALFCPFGTFHHAKVNGHDPKPFMKDFFRLSEMYSCVFWWIKEKLRDDERFIKMYTTPLH